jgi:hypothetical protein
MRLLDNKTEIEVCEKKFHELITKEDDMTHLFKMLDEILFDYSQYIISDDTYCGGTGWRSSQLLALRLFRDLFIMEDK